ncbi:hypothetical protein LR48_Vigan845s005500 [Vigna angularis]|uniref:Uncharacterized protein n=1 Tax=Phaseolus angularis TaxID=3914 RepID=A0A0L9THY2_PHAAN|nr:hypothetical protein LR48_Vigan845s005500 [Vigna angularis]
MLVRAASGSLMAEWSESDVDTDAFLLRGGREELRLCSFDFQVEKMKMVAATHVLAAKTYAVEMVGYQREWHAGKMIVFVEEGREKRDGSRLLMVLALVVTGYAAALMVVNGDDGEIVVSLHDCFRSTY